MHIAAIIKIAANEDNKYENGAKVNEKRCSGAVEIIGSNEDNAGGVYHGCAATRLPQSIVCPKAPIYVGNFSIKVLFFWDTVNQRFQQDTKSRQFS